MPVKRTRGSSRVLLLGNYVLRYEFRESLNSTTAYPSRSSLRKRVKGGNSSIFLSIRSAIPFRTQHRFPFEHGEQSPPWKREAITLKGCPAHALHVILNAYVLESCVGSILAVRAALRSESLSILCRRLIHEVIEQKQAEHIEEGPMLGIVLELVPGIDDHGGTAPKYVSLSASHCLYSYWLLCSSFFNWASNMLFQAPRYRSCQNKGRRTPFEYKVDQSRKGRLPRAW
jgi:hypothetical protein